MKRRLAAPEDRQAASGAQKRAEALVAEERITPVPPTVDEPAPAVAPTVAMTHVVPLPPAPKPPPAPTPAPVAAVSGHEQELTAAAHRLAKRKSMTAKDFAEASGFGEKKARSVLKELVAAGLAGQFKDGRVQRYWSLASGARPDIGLPARVMTVVPRIDTNAAVSHRARARQEQAARLDRQRRAAVPRRARSQAPVQGRLSRNRGTLDSAPSGRFGDGRAPRQLVLPPHTLDVLTLSARDGVGFSPRPAERAERCGRSGRHRRVQRSRPDGAGFERNATGARAARRKTWSGRRRDASVPPPVGVEPVFFPLWEITLQQDGGAGYRVVTIDALVGRPAQWPLPS